MNQGLIQTDSKIPFLTYLASGKGKQRGGVTLYDYGSLDVLGGGELEQGEMNENHIICCYNYHTNHFFVK